MQNVDGTLPSMLAKRRWSLLDISMQSCGKKDRFFVHQLHWTSWSWTYMCSFLTSDQINCDGWGMKVISTISRMNKPRQHGMSFLPRTIYLGSGMGKSLSEIFCINFYSRNTAVKQLVAPNLQQQYDRAMRADRGLPSREKIFTLQRVTTKVFISHDS